MKSILDKRSSLLRLAKVRQSASWPGYKCNGGAYECDFVSPYTLVDGKWVVDKTV